jgi:RNA polymerase sigma-70 factor (ECF subfamily)
MTIKMSRDDHAPSTHPISSRAGAPPDGADAALIERIAGGDRRAFGAFVERHWARLYRCALATSGDGAAAEDAIQEAFIAVWRSAASFRGGSARAWLFTIARNAACHEIRRRSGEQEGLVSLEDLGTAAAWDGPSSGDRVLRSLEDRDRLRKALAALSPEDQDALLLLDVEELKAEEAACALGVGVGAVKSRLHRARLRLVAQLAKEDDHAT